jgi:hypothetical protein
MATKIYIQDLKEMIATSINNVMEDKHDDDPGTYTEEWKHTIEKHLTDWQASTSPFSFRDTGYKSLVAAVSGNVTLNVAELPGISANVQVTREEVAQRILGKVNADHSVKLGIPFVARGSFQRVLPIALDIVTTLLGTEDHTAPEIVGLLYTVLGDEGIDFLPWVKDRGDSGRRYVSCDAFINCARSSTKPVKNPVTSTSQSSLSQPSNPLGGAWSIGQKPLCELVLFRNHTTMPTDAKLPPSPKPIWVDSRAWLSAVMENPAKIIKLSLLIGFCLNCMAPRYELAPKPAGLNISRSLFEAVRDVPWATPKGQITAQRQSPGVFSIWFLFTASLLDPESPLRQNMIANSNRLGADWTDVTSECKLDWVIFMTDD